MRRLTADDRILTDEQVHFYTRALNLDSPPGRPLFSCGCAACEKARVASSTQDFRQSCVECAMPDETEPGGASGSIA